MDVDPADARERRFRRRALRLEWGTNAWNLMEVVVTVSLGLISGSLALIAFGLDSLVEVFASTVVIWHLREVGPDPDDHRTHHALRLIAAAFFALSLYLLVASSLSLILGNRPGDSPIGIFANGHSTTTGPAGTSLGLPFRYFALAVPTNQTIASATAQNSQGQPIIDAVFVGDITRPGDAQNGGSFGMLRIDFARVRLPLQGSRNTKCIQPSATLPSAVPGTSVKASGSNGGGCLAPSHH